MVEADPARPISKAARNERRKAIATTCNAVSVTFFVTAGLQPLMAGRYNLLSSIAAAVGFIAFQAILHYVYGRWRTEWTLSFR